MRDHVCKAQQVSSIKSFHRNLCGPLIKGTGTAFELKIVTSLFSVKNLDRNKELVEGSIGLFCELHYKRENVTTVAVLSLVKGAL